SWEATMLMTGKEYLSSIRDGRRVYIGGELVEDVTAHPAFRNAAQSFAMIYDRKRDPENRDLMTFEEGWRNLLDLFLATGDARGSAATVRDSPSNCLMDARFARSLARQLPELCERAGDGSCDVRQHPSGLRHQHSQLLSAHAGQRYFRLPHRHQSTGLAPAQ